MYPNIEQSLRDWDYLEQLLLPHFPELGIPEDQYEFYMAWAKQKAELGLKYEGKTFEIENTILRTKWILRGLDPDILDALEPYVDEWIYDMRHPYCPFEFNDGFESGDFSKWDFTFGSGLVIQSEIQHHGTFGLRSDDSESHIGKNVLNQPWQFYTRLYFKLTGTYPSTYTQSNILHFGEHDIVLAITTGLTVSPCLRLWDIVNNVWQDGVTQIETDKWYCLEVYLEFRQIPARNKVWLNGELEISLDTNMLDVNLDWWYLQAVAWVVGYTGKLWYDCVLADRDTRPICFYLRKCQA